MTILARAVLAFALVHVPVYVLSSGPVLGFSFWLRDLTEWGGFYGVMWLYLPLLAMGHDTPLADYIDWWVVDVFDTSGPG